MIELGRNTLRFDFCWICQRRFRDSVPSGLAHREDHHIFPRNAGGTDGPIVSLCDSHHSCIHKLAQRFQSQKPYAELLAGESAPNIKKLLWLASAIVKAEAFAANDPNKVTPSQGVKLSTAETEMMRRLQTALPNSDRSDIFKKGLHLLYKKYFPVR